MPTELLGPLGLLVGLIAAVGVLWRDHLRSDADDRAQRDLALQGWKTQTDTNAKLIQREERRRRGAK